MQQWVKILLPMNTKVGVSIAGSSSCVPFSLDEIDILLWHFKKTEGTF